MVSDEPDLEASAVGEGRSGEQPVLGSDLGSRAEEPRASTGDPDARVLSGVHAYRLGRVIGEGGQGVVYEAEDLDVGRRVALKLLRSVSKGQLARFKREFRVRRRLRHRGLVEVGELATCEGSWFLTMELITGVPLLGYVRDSEARLRACFTQLASALIALHAHGMVHRDVKSENVLVSAQGRAVLLDFGLAMETQSEVVTQLMGTPAYMAPEQWAGVPACEAGDWYAFGVLLYEALVGSPPFSGHGLELLRNKTHATAPRVDERAPTAPADLAALCEGLLNPDPAERFGRAEVRATLAQVVVEPVRVATEQCLVGRERELEALRIALADAGRGEVRLVRIEGASGLGKSALLDSFRESISAADSYWVFGARCYEGESVPFNAIDAVLDELASGLRQHVITSLDRYRPRHVALLTRVFPALSFLAEGRGSASVLPIDPAELRERAVISLLELVERMGDVRPVVLLFDDMHWADADSCALLERLARAQFPLLMVAAQRDGETGAGAGLWSGCAGLTKLSLAALDLTSARALIEQVTGSAIVVPERLQTVYRESAGSPYLLSEWACHLRERHAPDDIPINELLQQRVAVLPPSHRRLLITVALCAAPLSLNAGLSAADCDGLIDVSALCDQRLLCVVNKPGGLALDLYHAKLREAALQSCSERERDELRERIIAVLDAQRAPAEQLVHLQLAAGRREQAAALAREGALAAERTFAFARAADLFGLAAELSEVAEEATALRLRQASAFQNALRPASAGDSLLAAAAGTKDPERAAELTRLAGEQLLFSGEHTRGLATIERSLRHHGFALAADANGALGQTMVLFQQLMARGLTLRAHAGSPAQRAAHAERVALSTSIALSLHHVDLRGVPFALQGLLDALDLDDRQLRQRALATFVVVTASHWPNPLIEPALELCREHTERADGYGQALLQLALIERAHFAGDAPSAERGCERAERILLDSCAGISRELGLVRTTAVVVRHSIRGDFAAAERAEAWLADADRRGDVFSSNWLRSSCALMWMAQDDSARARAEIARAEQNWPAARGGTFETACALYLDALDRYDDKPAVHLSLGQARPTVLESPLAATELLQGYLHLQRAWGCLRELGERADQHSHEECAALRVQLTEALAVLQRASLATWRAIGAALEANAALLAGDLERAEGLLDQARAGFVSGHAASPAACALRRLGEVVGGELGLRWIGEADAELSRLGVVAPARFARAYWSPFRWPKQ